MQCIKKDNSNPRLKAELRKRFISSEQKVLDLFSGDGEMWKRAYKNNVSEYRGIDKIKKHNENCEVEDNRRFIKNNNLDNYDVFDLDDYGSPWKLFFNILAKIKSEKRRVFFVTDGLPLRMSMGGITISKLICASEKIPKKMNIPCIKQWYIEIIKTLLLRVEEYGHKVEKIYTLYIGAKRVCYWVIILDKTGVNMIK